MHTHLEGSIIIHISLENINVGSIAEVFLDFLHGCSFVTNNANNSIEAVAADLPQELILVQVSLIGP